MIMPIDPTTLAKAQQVGQHIESEIRIVYPENKVVISFSSDVGESEAFIPGLMEQFADALAAQLSSFFAIRGEIVEEGKQ